MSLPLHTRATVASPLIQARLAKVLGLPEALRGRVPFESVVVDLREPGDLRVNLDSLSSMGFAGVLTDKETVVPASLIALHSMKDPVVVRPGDAVRLHPSGQMNVLFRRGANANTLFATERCNSRCLMCSQPPRDDDDRWRIAEMVDLLPLIDRDLSFLGITGGEPTLLGEGLVEVFAAAAQHLPTTRLHVLTNGRLFADPQFAARFRAFAGKVVWAIPLYAANAQRHDYVVQAENAFDETLNGIYNLAEYGHRIEVRCVVHKQTVGGLVALSEFLFWNMPFVEHVAFMGLEPMGYARGNRDLLWVDPVDTRAEVEAAAWHLHERGISTSIYNTPLCILSPEAWGFARQSISDWKNSFAPECENCTVRDRCSGFFKSAGPEWRSRSIKPILN